MSSTNRRRFLQQTAAAATLLAGTPLLRNAQSATPDQHKVVERTDFARLQQIADGVWAVVSTPLDGDGNFAHPETICNGGLIAGQDKVLAIDAFLQPAGAAWLTEKSVELTGKRPTDVIVTHFHADHSGGLAGYQNGVEGPEIYMTETTRQLIHERYGVGRPQNNSPFSRPATRVVGPSQIITDETQKVKLDLGGRSVTIEPLSGHTPSDLAIHLDDEPIIFAGDLVWSGLFHNYTDAIPSKLRSSVESLLSDPDKFIVTGHGEIGYAKDLHNYLQLLIWVEEQAKAAHASGKTAAEGASTFTIPDHLGQWPRFSANYYELAFSAWYRELSAH